MLRSGLAACIALFLPVTAAAEIPDCDELWFTRNAQFHLAGFCFGSTLGQAVFGNDGCSGTDVTLSDEARALVDRVLAEEAALGCATDTTRRTLEMDMSMIPDRLALRHHPVITFGESACIGWRGPSLPLMSGHSGEGSQRATVEPGDTLLFSHYPEGEWDFVTLYDGETETLLKGIGWVALVDWGSGMCDMYAG